MSDNRANSTVRILDASGVTIGGGVLIEGEHVLTAAHVVDAALGRPENGQRPHEDEALRVDFPGFGQAPVGAHVTKWSPLSQLDIAVLQLHAAPPSGAVAPTPWLEHATPAELAAGIAVSSYGFPAADPDGIFASGQIVGRMSGDRYQLDNNWLAGQPVEDGFSGCPVWREVDGQYLWVGILLAADKKRRISAMTASADLFAFMNASGPKARRGGDAWYVSTFRGPVLTNFLHDIGRHERQGIDDSVCEAVKGALTSVCNTLSGMAYVGLSAEISWDEAPCTTMERFHDAYNSWNDECESAEERFRALREIRKHRSRLTEQLRIATNVPLYVHGSDHIQAELLEQVDEMIDTLFELASAHPSVFSKLRAALVRTQALRVA